MNLSAVHLQHRNSSLVADRLHPTSGIPLLPGRGIRGGGFFAHVKRAAYYCQAVIVIMPRSVQNVDMNARLRREAKMKLKIVKIITVCLITLGVITPSLVTFGLIYEQHSFQKLHYVVYKFQGIHEGVHKSIFNYKITDSQKDFGRLACSAANITSQLTNTPVNQQKAIAIFLLQLIFIIFPISLALGTLLYNRYCIYRTAVFKDKVQMLERMWQQSIQQ